MGTGQVGGLPSEFLRKLPEDLQVRNSWPGSRWCPGKRPTSVGRPPDRGAEASCTPAPGQAPASTSGAVWGRAARSAPAWGRSAGAWRPQGPGRPTRAASAQTGRHGDTAWCAPGGYGKDGSVTRCPFQAVWTASHLSRHTEMTYIYMCKGSLEFTENRISHVLFAITMVSEGY